MRGYWGTMRRGLPSLFGNDPFACVFGAASPFRLLARLCQSSSELGLASPPYRKKRQWCQSTWIYYCLTPHTVGTEVSVKQHSCYQEQKEDKETSSS